MIISKIGGVLDDSIIAETVKGTQGAQRQKLRKMRKGVAFYNDATAANKCKGTLIVICS